MLAKLIGFFLISVLGEIVAIGDCVVRGEYIAACNFLPRPIPDPRGSSAGVGWIERGRRDKVEEVQIWHNKGRGRERKREEGYGSGGVSSRALLLKKRSNCSSFLFRQIFHGPIAKLAKSAKNGNWKNRKEERCNIYKRVVENKILKGISISRAVFNCLILLNFIILSRSDLFLIWASRARQLPSLQMECQEQAWGHDSLTTSHPISVPQFVLETHSLV